MKTPIFDGLRLVLISVPHRAYDTVKIESELTGRVQQLKIPMWAQNELQEIAQKGFPCLNVVLDRLISEMLAKEPLEIPN